MNSGRCANPRSLLPPPAALGRCWGREMRCCKARARRQPGGSEDAFRVRALCSEEQHFTCLCWCRGRGDHGREKMTAHAAAAGDNSPPPGTGNPFTTGSRIQRAGDGDGFGIPATPIPSPPRRCLPQPVSPVPSQPKLPRGMWLAVCWQTPHPFQLHTVQFPSRAGEPGGNATEARGVVLQSLE